jgi:hypothetical protein
MTTANAKTVSVRLTKAGEAAAAGGTLSVHGGSKSVTFEGDVAQTVSLDVWNMVLQTTAPQGKPFFEIVPATDTLNHSA